jgi:hypothetical protein
MNQPSVPASPVAAPQPAAADKTGEGAETALAAMIRKRRMGENHVEPEPPQAQPSPAALRR